MISDDGAFIAQIIGWSFLGGVVGAIILNHKGYSPLIGMIAGAVLGPVLVLLCLIAEPKGGVRKCPWCSETIKRNAIVCRYCGHNILSTPIDETSSASRFISDKLSETGKIV